MPLGFNGAITAAFGYLANEVGRLGLSFELPATIADDVTAAARWLGYGNFVMGNGVSFGVVWQFQGAVDDLHGNSVGYDFGVYGQVSAPVGNVPAADIAVTADLGAQYGTIHNGFDGRLVGYSANVIVGGAEVIYSMDENGNLTFSGLAARAGPGVGFSVNQSQTGAATLMDGWRYFFGR